MRAIEGIGIIVAGLIIIAYVMVAKEKLKKCILRRNFQA